MRSATPYDNSTDAAEGWPYADAVEELAVGPSNGSSAQLGAKAVVVMDIWMTIAHKLYEAVRSCEKLSNAPELIDSAVGLWIGQQQGEGKYNSGWSMYSIAQEANEFYGLPEGEAVVNTNLMNVNAQNVAQSCSSDLTSAGKTIRNLSVPLLQHLFFHMSDNNFAFAELFALASLSFRRQFRLTRGPRNIFAMRFSKDLAGRARLTTISSLCLAKFFKQ
jgi:hypothetical protein